MSPHLSKPTKNELTGALNNLFNNYIFGITLLYITESTDLSFLQETTINAESPYSQARIDLAPLFSGVSSIKQRPILVEEYLGMLRRTVLAETYEVLKWYCNHTDQFSIFRSQPWYGFLYVLRNSVSHRRGGWLMWDDKVADPVSQEVRWNHLAFNKTDKEKEITLHDADIMLFLRDIQQFSEILA